MNSKSQKKNVGKDFLSLRNAAETQEGKETMSKMLKDVREKLQKKGRGLKKTQTCKGAIYLGHIPHGFYEEEMHKFFSQFGKIEKIRLARSQRTGKSKGYAFVQFKDDRVAKIAAEAMNNYLMFHKILKCSYIAPKKDNENLFRRAFTKETDCRIAKKRQIMFKRLNKEMSPKQQKNFKIRTLRKIKQTLATLSSMGITYSPVIYNPDISAEINNQIEDMDVSTEVKSHTEVEISSSENQELDSERDLSTNSSQAEKKLAKLGKSAQKKNRKLGVAASSETLKRRKVEHNRSLNESFNLKHVTPKKAVDDSKQTPKTLKRKRINQEQIEESVLSSNEKILPFGRVESEGKQSLLAVKTTRKTSKLINDMIKTNSAVKPLNPIPGKPRQVSYNKKSKFGSQTPGQNLEQRKSRSLKQAGKIRKSL